MTLAWVFLGGGLGATLRYLVQLSIGKSNGESFPWSTFLINISGCLLIGIVAVLIHKYRWNEAFSMFLVTGILGGFTTFSAFSLDFVELMKNNHFGLALLYAGLTNFVGLSLTAVACYFYK